MNRQRQQVLILYLASSALDTPVVAWSIYDGTGRTKHMAADSDERNNPSSCSSWPWQRYS